jgi:hypothetical protein
MSGPLRSCWASGNGFAVVFRDAALEGWRVLRAVQSAAKQEQGSFIAGASRYGHLRSHPNPKPSPPAFSSLRLHLRFPRNLLATIEL